MFTQVNFGIKAGCFSAPFALSNQKARQFFDPLHRTRPREDGSALRCNGALRRSAIAPLWSSRRAQRIFSKTPLAFMRPKNALIQGFAHRAHQNPKRIMVTMRKQVQKITAVAARATSSAAC